MIGDRIKATRLAKGMSGDDLARAIGASRQTVSNWERGIYTPSRDNIFALADTLGVTPETLMKEETT